jgi:hypothetical protein
MSVFIVWCETVQDGQSAVLGYCKTEDLARRAIDADRALNKPGAYSYWVEEIEELLEE